MKRNLLTNSEEPRPASAKVGANRLGWMRILMGVVFTFLLSTLINTNSQGQVSYLGLDGGFEGSATIDNTTINTAPQANTWTKANVTQTIADETTIFRSGLHSLRINNTSTTGRRVWSPLITISSTTSEVTIQYYRYVSNATNSQSNQEGVIRSGTESLQNTYDTPTAGTWEKQTFSPTSSTYTTIAGIIMHKQIGTGGNMYIDDMCIYTSGVDVIAPNAATASVIGTPTTSSLTVSWTAASGGVDGGGYLVVRGIADPTTAPNVNGIYAVGNTIGSGTVVYQGTGTSFVDNGLSAETTYFYRVYTYDKAYNYSAAITGNGTTLSSSAPTITVTPTTLTGFSYIEGAGPSAQQSFSCSGTNLTNDITLTAPTNYEISTTSGSGFGTTITLTQSGGTVGATTIYVRLIASLPAGNYNLETINATSTGATAKTVTLSGTVIGPIITITPTTISGIEYDFGSGPSAAESFSVSGTGLTANILLTAPSNYEIATVVGGPYGGTLTLTQSGGVVNSTTIYLRLKAGLSVGNYNQSVSATSTGAASKTVYLTGSVKSTPCLLEGFNNGTTAPASWIFTSIGGTYTSSTNYGVASPSLSMDATNDRVLTPVIGGATELSFWIKGQGTNATSALLVEGYNGTIWSTIENIIPLPTTGTVKTYNSASSPALAAGFTQFRFTYTKSVGNLAFDDVTVICTSVPNTVTTGTVSNAPFSVSCATGSAGSVAFTSTDIFSSNTYTAQLSNAAGSFASPVNIGSLMSDANSGTINVTIPPGTPTGAGYSIRVISSNPVVIGTSSAAFSVTLTDGPCSCYEIESILVDACDEGVEGENEMFRFSVGAGNLSTGDILIDWPNNPWLGICQNAASDSIVAGINATLTPPGQIVQPVGGVIPAGATVMFFTSTAFDFSKFDFSSLNYTLYAVFQCEGNTAGHFGNYTATGEKTLVFDCGACSSESVTYDTDSLYTGDGATVDFDVPGTPTYSDSGYCESVPVFDILPIDLMYFKTVCNNDELYFAWATATETNNAYFTIEAADVANGDFVPVAKVDGAGNSNEMLEYSINVETKAKYFRLKQTDFDGKFTYSDVIAVDCEDSQVQLFPSLAAEGENITIVGEVCSIRVFDSMGREVFPEINENKVCCLEPGMYFFVINGKWNHKVVVQ